MDDESYRLLQLELMDNPSAGDVIEGTGGLRKLRQALTRVVAKASAAARG